MEQTGVIVGTLPGNRVQVEIQRKAACASDCEKCGGCAHPDQVMVVEAPNTCGARIGERVTIKARAGVPAAHLADDRVLLYPRRRGRPADLVFHGRPGCGRGHLRAVLPPGQAAAAGVFRHRAAAGQPLICQDPADVLY